MDLYASKIGCCCSMKMTLIDEIINIEYRNSNFGC